MKRRAIVSGAGIAGLTAAWWLRQAGWDVTVIEKSAALRDGGYLIGLSGPGLNVARRMGLGDRLSSLAHRYDENVYFDRSGRELLRLNYGSIAGHIDYLVLRRADLVSALAELDPSIAIRRNVTWVDHVWTPNGVAVTLSDGDVLEGDVLIGAEGLRSPLRRQLASDAEALQQLGYRFAAYECDRVLDSRHDYVTYVQPGLFSGFYRLRHDRTACLHLWRSSENGYVAPERRWALLREILATSHGSVRNALPGDPSHPVLDDLAMPVLPRWSNGRICLIGDAGHGLTLMSGQGAGMAMASALCLAQELTVDDVESAVVRHRTRMAPVIAKLQQRSRRIATWFIPGSRLGLHARMFAMRHLPRPLLRRHLLSAVQSELELSNSLDR